MRNPAPLVLSLALALVAVFFLVRKPDAPAETAPTEAAEAAEEAAETPTEPAADPVEASTATTAVAEEPPADVWPHQSSDIPADPDATFGRLANGMRYIVLPNPEPPGRISLRLHIAAGSLMEAEDQRGIAHFLEHMVFNGTKNFTPDELIPRMQRLGVAFGAHVNAYTSFDETVYMLDLPETDAEMLELGFTVMRDFADGALLLEEEIDKERGVILAEKTSRDSVGYRLMEKQFKQLLPESLVTKRFPIGEEEVISNAPRERFVDFYSRYYVPERMTFVVVGDVDPAAISARIEQSFASLEQPADAGGDPELGTATPASGLQPAVFADKEVASTDLGLLTIDDWDPLPDTRENRIVRMPLTLAHAVLGRRFERIAKQEGAPIVGGSASRDELFNHLELGSIDVTVADDQWQGAVGVLEQEFRRALEFGFTEAELAEAKANLLNAYRRAVETKDTRRSDGLATGIVQTLNSGRVLTEPETDLEIISKGLDEITPASCHEDFRDFWGSREGRPRDLHLILTTKVEPEGAVETLGELYRESSTVALEPPVEAETAEFAHGDFGPAGEVASRNEVEDLGITLVELSNGIHVHLKPTDFDEDTIMVRANIGHGQLTLPADKPGLDQFASALVNQGGIGEHSTDELKRILAGRNVSVGRGGGFAVGEDSFSLGGRTTPKDLELQLQLMAAQIELLGLRDEAVTQFRKGLPMIEQQMKHTPAGAVQKMRAWLHGDDPRYVFPGVETLAAYTVDDARPWLESAFQQGEIELNLVGDFETEAVLPLVLKTFGALEPRPQQPVAESLRRVKFPNAPATKNYRYESKIPQAAALVVWQTEGRRDNHEGFRRLKLLSDVLRDRLRETIREELGASYSPYAEATGSTVLEDFGFIIAQNTCDPEDAETLANTSIELAAVLADKGISEDDLERAREPTLAEVRKAQRENAYWLDSVLSGLSREPEKLELARTLLDDLASITVAELNRLAARHLAAENALKVVITPTGGE